MERIAVPGARWAAGADTLTALRFLTAPVLAPLVWSESWSLAALLLAAAWIGDVADGRLARRGGTPTRLGEWDMAADTAVGAGLVVGLVGQGTLPLVMGLPALVVFGALFVAGNLAAAMLLQLVGYLPFLYLLWSERPALWWLPFATIVFAGLINWRRLFFVAIPAFLRGLTGRFERPFSRIKRGL